jgi:hypothetical protein
MENNSAGFNDILLVNLKLSLTRLNRTQWSKVESAFKYVQNYQGAMYNSQSAFLITLLNKGELKSQTKRIGSKLSEEQIADINTALLQITKQGKAIDIAN